MIQLINLKSLEKNPRKITSKNKRVLKESLEEDIKFLEFKPLLVDEDNNILAGNQRYNILLEMGYTEIPDEWVKCCIGLTDAEKKRLIVKDNVSMGQFTSDIYDYIDKEKVYDYNIKLKDDWNPFEKKCIEEYNKVEIDFPIYIMCDEVLFNKWKSLKQHHKLKDNELLKYLIEEVEND